MTLEYYTSPFHVTHKHDVANRMALNMDLMISIVKLIKAQQLTKKAAATLLDIRKKDVMDLLNYRLNRYTNTQLQRMLSKLEA